MNVQAEAEELAAKFRIETAIDHSYCHQRCRPYCICPTCGADTFIWITHGRWDEERKATAMPFDPVAVTLKCEHVIGDKAAADPERSNR